MEITMKDTHLEIGHVSVDDVIYAEIDKVYVEYRVEEALIYLAVTELEKLGAKSMEVVYEPTDRNRPTLKVLEEAKLEKIDAQKFRVNFESGYEKPEFVKLNFMDL